MSGCWETGGRQVLVGESGRGSGEAQRGIQSESPVCGRSCDCRTAI